MTPLAGRSPKRWWRMNHLPRGEGLTESFRSDCGGLHDESDASLRPDMLRHGGGQAKQQLHYQHPPILAQIEWEVLHLRIGMAVES